MKTKFTTIILLFSLFSAIAKAQDAKYISAMQNGLTAFEEAKTSADYVAAANQFERIGNMAKTEWLPYYYAAFSQMLNNTLLAKADDKDAVLNKASELIEQAAALKSNESEILAMQGYISFMKIYVNPMARMQAGMAAAMADLEKAKVLNPENPRPYFIIAQNTFYTPEAFGGGKKAAKSKLEEAASKFEAFKPVNALLPNWGKERNAALLAQCGQ